MSSASIHYRDRFELKYLMRISDRARLLERLRQLLAARSGYREEDQQVFSLYLDTPTLEMFWDKVDGEEIREKLRLRGYRQSVDGPFDALFLEQKLKLNQNVRKSRVQLRASSPAQGLGEALRSPEAYSLSSYFVQSMHRLLVPAVMLQYRRTALESPLYPHLRVTVDSFMRVRSANDLGSNFSDAPYGVPPQLCILEVKYSYQVPPWVCEMIDRHQLVKMRISKYALAVNAFAKQLERHRAVAAGARFMDLQGAEADGELAGAAV